MIHDKKYAIAVLGGHQAFADLGLPLYHSLKRLGYEPQVLNNAVCRGATNIILGLCDCSGVPLDAIPENSIIYNLEQLVEGSKGVNSFYIDACSKFKVWDYSQENIKRFKDKFGIDGVEYVPMGYCPEMSRIDPEYPKDIDVLMYGAINERRRDLIARLREAGVNAVAFQGLFGVERDIMIARSKIVLNAHYYLPGIQEIIRLGYLWANKKCVVCECNPDTEIHEGCDGACLYAPYDQLVDQVVKLLRSPRAIDAMGKAAFLQFSQRSFADVLRPFVGECAQQTAVKEFLPLPGFLNVGSGKNFLHEALNVDIDPKWSPDFVFDISQPLDFGAQHSTQRFGTVAFREGMFDTIRLFDVLEHVADVPLTMRNLLTLLRDGGELHLNVPYDLSLGAWQDPTHRQAFNENSWLYYTEWHWYLGWREWRFDTASIEYVFSPLGEKMRKQGTALPAILRMPRAVDSMEVRLRKRATTFEEKTMFDKESRAFYAGPQADWTLQAVESKLG